MGWPTKGQVLIVLQAIVVVAVILTGLWDLRIDQKEVEVLQRVVQAFNVSPNRSLWGELF